MGEVSLAEIHRVLRQFDFGMNGERRPTGIPKSRAQGARGYVPDQRARVLLNVPAVVYHDPT